MKIRYIILTLLLALSSCAEDFLTRDFPSVLTLSVTETSDRHLLFSGEIISRSSVPVDEVGFLWQSGSDPDIENGFRANLAGKVNNGPFSLKVSTSIKRNTDYYVKAYARVGELIIYGDTWVFSSNIDFAPPVLKIEPSTGQVGDTVEISGGLFERKIEKNSIKVSGVTAEIIEVTDSLIIFKIPYSLTTKENTVVAAIEGLETVVPEKFVLTAPTISNFNPSVVNILDSVEISGTGFHPLVDFNKVYFGDSPAKVLTASRTKLVIEAPYTPDSIISIKVNVSGQEVISPGKIKVIGPILKAIRPSEGIFLDTIFLGYKNFDPQLIKNVYVGNILTKITGYKTDSIGIQIPESLNKEYSKILIKFNNYEVAVTNEFHLIQPVIENVSPIDLKEYEIVKIEGNNFSPNSNTNKIYLKNTDDGKIIQIRTGTCSKSKIEAYIHSIQSTPNRIVSGDYYIGVQTCENIVWYPGVLKITSINPFRQLNNFPGNGRYKAGSFIINNTAYVGFGAESGIGLKNDLWEYNPNSDSWTRKADFPGAPRILPVMLSNSLYGYSGGGQSTDNSSTQEPLKDFYRYNPQTNSWTKMTDIPAVEKSYPGVSASTNQNNLLTNTVAGNLYSYNETINSWGSEYTGTAMANRWPGSFVINNKVYFVGGANNSLTNGTNNQVWMYDPVTKSMTRKSDFPGKSRYGGFSFTIGEYGYFGGGINYVYNISFEYLNDIYRYDPDTDTWSYIGEFPRPSVAMLVSFVLNGKAYLLTGYNGSNTNNEVWEFTDPANVLK